MNSSTSNSDAGRPAGRSGRWPGALFLAAALAAAIEALVAAWPRPLRKDLVRHRLYSPAVAPDIAESIVQWQVAHATLMRERQDLLLLGDSACLIGLDAPLLMERTGFLTWNLGTFGFIYTTGQADILELFIERCGPPRFLVYHSSHYSFTAGRRKKAVRTWVSRLRRWLAPPESVRHVLPSLRFRQEIRDALFALGREAPAYAGLDQPRGRWASDNEIRRQLWENRGSLLDAQEVDIGERLGDDIVWEPRFNPDCGEGLKRIFEAARIHGFPVLILFNPLPVQADNPVVRKAMARLEAEIEKTIRPYPGVSVYKPFLRFYPNDLCSDMRHVNYRGALHNTEELAAWIRSHWPARED